MISSNDDSLHHLAFDNSMQANIITEAGNGKIVMANPAACKLLGYSKKLLLTKSRAAIFDINETSFKKMLKQRMSEGQSKALVTVLKKNGKQIPCEITSAVFIDEEGIEKLIYTISDRSESILEQKTIDIQKEKIVADDIILAKSKQKGIDIKKEKIVADNIVLARSKQKDIDVKKEKIVADNIILAKSKQKGIDIKKEKIVADNIILAQARSDKENIDHESHARRKLLAEIEKNFRIMFHSSADVLFDSDLVANKVMINDAYEKEFGYKKNDNMAPAEDWVNHIHPDDKEAITEDYFRMLASTEMEWKYSFRFLKADNSITNVLSKGIVLRYADGKAYRRIGYLLDISKEKILEERLEQEIKLKENQIAEAAEDAKNTERSDIGKELHDNINQLLGASRMFLEMAKRGGENSKMYLTRSSEYTLKAIEEIRKLTKSLTTDIIRDLGLCDAIDNLTRDTMEVNPIKISCALGSFIENSVTDKFKLNMLRIVQEQLNNILKHAGATKVAIRLLQNKKSTILSISDNGIGFDTAKKRTGIGVDNIKSRAQSYNGIADFVSAAGHGCVLTVTFPVSGMLLNAS